MVGVTGSLLLATGACGGSSSDAEELTVFAAASLTGAFTEIGAAYRDEAGVEVTFNFAGSSELATQIVEGAPADVYASADRVNMAKAVDADAITGTPEVFATNTAEIVVGHGNPLGVTGLDDLGDPALLVVTCAPQVPCGAYAGEIFTRAELDVTPDSYERNVKSVVTKVALGEADAGIAYTTDVTAAGDDVAGIEIPADLNVVAEYPIAVVAESADTDASRAFVDFVLGDDGQTILDRNGFGTP